MAEARYDAVADFYAAAFDDIDDPATAVLLDLLGPPAGLSVLDIACGHGRVTRELARRGAVMTGVDISAALLARAVEAERERPLGIRYIHADVSALSGSGASAAGLGAAVFDAVTCNFGLSDVDDLTGTLAGVGIMLRPGGCFVFSILHPCFPGAADVSASWPPTARYYDQGWWRADAALSPLRQQVGANHRMVSTYLNGFRRHDLWLDELAEPEPASQWTEKRPGASRLPVYLAGRCLKEPR